MMRLVTDTVEPIDEAEAALLMPEPDAPATDDAAAWPGEVDMILSAMDAAAAGTPIDETDTDAPANRRTAARRPLRTRADLRLHASDTTAPPLTIFTRDISASGVGFITQQRLPLGYSGLVRLVLDEQRTITATCSIYRCRPAIGNWYEGALHFAKRQPDVD